MKILFLVPYPTDEAPSQRFRFEQYYSLLVQNGHSYSTQSFLSVWAWKKLYQPGNILPKLWAVLLGFVKRLIILGTLNKYNFVFIHREATSVGPPIFEWLIGKVFRKKIIYDFDDAIWLTDKTTEPWLQKTVRWRKKVFSICKWSYKVSCGNNYLADHARQFNQNVVICPTTIDTLAVHNPSLFTENSSVSQNVIIGWTGSHSTLKYLAEVEPVLQQLEKKYPHVRLLVIANQKPGLNLKSVEFVPWRKETEIEDLLKIDIGIMPLHDDDWSKGKCGFKALQYMALEIPTIASRVGVNPLIVDHNTNGFLCSTREEWVEALNRLIKDAALRKSFGKNGRLKIINQFSVASNAPVFLSLFQ